MAFWLTFNDSEEPRPRLFSRRIALPSGPVGDRLLLKTIDGNAEIAGIASSGNALRAAWLETAPGSDPPEGRLVTQALDSAGQLSGLLVEIPIATEFDIYSATFRGIADGRFLVAWVQQLGDSPAEAFGAVVSDGPPPAPAVSLPSLSLEVDSAGRAMVGWWELLGSPPAYPWPTRIWRQGFAVTGVPLTAAVSVATVPRQSFPSVSVSSNGNWVVAWGWGSEDGTEQAIDAELGSFQDGCEPSEQALCLMGGRFRATATFHDYSGNDGEGTAVPLTTESGTFWFFTSASVELIVKVVDACSHPDFENLWVYASGLTNVEVRLTVVDTWTGAIWEHETSLGEPFQPVLDSQAFHTCGAAPFQFQ